MSHRCVGWASEPGCEGRAPLRLLAGLRARSTELIDDIARDGITANVVYPPVTDTGWITEEVRAFVGASPDHVHIAEPAEVAEVIGWLCTDAARLVTGNIFRLR